MTPPSSLLSPPRGGGRGKDYVLLAGKLTATQSKTYLGRASKAPVEAYIRKE